MSTTGTLQLYTGGCHCGQVRFEVNAPPTLDVVDCNCSICRKAGFLHLIVPADRFRLLQGEDALVDYRFNTGTARHRFCGRCGIKAFYIPRSHPDGVDVNVRCLDIAPDHPLTVTPFDGRHWEDNVAGLDALPTDAPLSR
ncbi:MAG: GFA family protein [Xanthomonadaceae bacterium]|nr:GFA family protein [Xanthomonadaceae bacterium]